MEAQVAGHIVFIHIQLNMLKNPLHSCSETPEHQGRGGDHRDGVPPRPPQGPAARGCHRQGHALWAGPGGDGQVASAVHKPTGKKVAIKKMDGVFEDEVDCKRILREVTLLRRLKHPYVVELFDVIEPKNITTFDTLYVVLELAESDLKKVIKSAIHL